MIRPLCLAIAAAMLLAACASLSESECRAGDWYGIGVADGAQGRLPSHLERHARACAEAGVTPDRAAWMRGRDVGLRQYCTPQTAYREGRAGREIAPVCPGGPTAEMQQAALIGLQYHAISREIDRLERRLADLDDDIFEKPGDVQNFRLRALYFARKLSIEREIDALRRERLAYATLPAALAGG